MYKGCDQGVRATGASPGDLNGRVVACAAAASVAGLANPLVYDAVGVLYCGINSAQPGTYQVASSAASTAQTLCLYIFARGSRPAVYTWVRGSLQAQPLHALALPCPTAPSGTIFLS